IFFQQEHAIFDNSLAVFPVDAEGNQSSDQPVSIPDSSSKTGYLYSAYVQDEWKGGRTNSWTDLRRDSKTLPVFDGAEGTERDLDTLCVIPADIRVNDFNELINGRGPPVTGI
ncbi:hypothetical protein B0G75_1391, partial [Paraburkholderia sp. BL18I3N2]